MPGSVVPLAMFFLFCLEYGRKLKGCHKTGLVSGRSFYKQFFKTGRINVWYDTLLKHELCAIVKAVVVQM